jgi:hypothetical protein
MKPEYPLYWLDYYNNETGFICCVYLLCINENVCVEPHSIYGYRCRYAFQELMDQDYKQSNNAEYSVVCRCITNHLLYATVCMSSSPIRICFLLQRAIEYPAAEHGKAPLGLVLRCRVPATLQSPIRSMFPVQQYRISYENQNRRARHTLIVANVMLFA